ncbi:periplasmic heavy metal sensor [Phycobacter sp. K97]|uniref:periplasmic heavy metal sensor n=1 Tax=Phycobacter sedimenti TaxID=3133977 RepID=UPI00311D5DD9
MTTENENGGKGPTEQPDAPASKPEQKTGMRPWLKVVLAVSLAANLAVAGLAVGAALRWQDGGHPDRRPPSVGSMIYRDLDGDTRRDLRRRAEGEHGSYLARRRAEGDAVITLLLADPFDAPALAGLLQRQAETRHAFHLSVQDAWIAQVTAMPTEQRQTYARRLQSKLYHRGDWEKRHQPGR